MTPVSARIESPWPIIIFALAIIFQLVRGLWRQFQDRDTSAREGDSFPPFRPIYPSVHPRTERRATVYGGPIPPALTETEVLARLERQLRGGPEWKEVAPASLEPTVYQGSRESGPGPTTENWVNLSEAAEAMRDAHRRLAHADSLATESIPPMQEASAALKEARTRLAIGDSRVTQPEAPRGAVSTARRINVGLAAEMARSFREPATARGAVIAAILLGLPKAFE